MAPKSGPKSDLKVVHKIIQKLIKKFKFWVPKRVHLDKKYRSDPRCFEHLLAYFEDEPKMVSKLFKIAQKRSQNDPKMVQDWIKLRKIAPKTAQDSPKWVHKVTL